MSSLLFFYSTNPFSLGLILITQTIATSLFLGYITKSFWFLYLLILIFIGGILVLFIYVTTIFPNEKFIFNQSKIIITIRIIFFYIIILFSIKYFFNLNLPYNRLINNYITINENIQLKTTIKIFISQSNLLIILIVNYLFYCIIVVIKIVNFFKGPLRIINYV